MKSSLTMTENGSDQRCKTTMGKGKPRMYKQSCFSQTVRKLNGSGYTITTYLNKGYDIYYICTGCSILRWRTHKTSSTSIACKCHSKSYWNSSTPSTTTTYRVWCKTSTSTLTVNPATSNWRGISKPSNKVHNNLTLMSNKLRIRRIELEWRMNQTK